MPARSLPEALVRAAAPPPAPGTDADLLNRFISTQDSEAFAELVNRHGPMVLGVCRRTLGNTPDADDAFQAVWLVLVRKAPSIQPRGQIGNWLYGVATRTAAHSRATSRRRKPQELPDVPDPQPHNPDSAEVVAVVDAELAKLPDKYRAAVVLCELEGRPLKEAADELGVPVGTVASRLARGRAMLAEQLRARGFAAATLVGVFATATAPVSARLAELTLSLLKISAQPVSHTVTELARGVMAVMFTNKLKMLGKWAVAAVVATGTVVWVTAVGAQPESPPAPPQSGPPIEDRGGNPYAGRLVPPGLPTWEDRAWDELLRDDPEALRAAFDLANSPKSALHLFDMKKKLLPLKASKEEVKKWISDLASEKDEVWRPAMSTLYHFDPRLALDPEAAFAEAKTLLAKQRLGAILASSSDPARLARPGLQSIELVTEERPDSRLPGPHYVLLLKTGASRAPAAPERVPIARDVDALRYEKPVRATWVRDMRAIIICEQLGSPALPLLKEMAKGHPDAIQTRVAQNAVARLTAPPP